MENKPSAGVSMGMIPSSDLDNGIAQPEKIQGSEPGVKKLALEIMWQEIRTLTSSMTSVPIPLEFLCPHYGALKTYYITMEDSDLKKYLADILSVLALTMSAERERESLKYRLLGSGGDIGSRGHEYVRNLAGEISQEYTNRQQQEEATIDDLMELIHQIVAFHIKHNAEPESVDLLMEESVDPPAEVFKTFHEKIKKYCDIALLACAYAGTGNVLKVQHLLGQCAQHLEEGETHQGPAMLGIAKVAMTEELGLEMAIRSLEHLLQYGEQNICHAVPLALGLLCISNPKVNVMDTLSRLSHEIDSGVAMVRIAQALVHMGKGFLTLASEPFLPSSAYLKMDQGGQRFDKTGTTVIALISKAGIYFIHDGIAPDDTGELGPAPDDLKGGLISDLPNIMYVLTYGCAPMLAEVRQHALEFVHEQRALHAISPTIDEVVRFVSGYLHRDYTGNGVGTLIIGGFHGGIPRIAVVKRKRNGHSSYQWNPRFACAGGGAGAARTYLCTVNEEDGYLGHLHEAMARASLADPNTGGTITTRLMSSSTDINVLSRFNVHLFGIGE